MSSGKHIVWVTSGFPKDEADTSCIPPLQAYARTMIEMHPSVRISILALHYPKRNSSYKWHGIRVWSFHADRWGWWSKVSSWFGIRKVLKTLHEEQPIDCVHSFWLNDATLWPQRFCKKEGIPQIATIMGQDALASNKYLSWIDLSRLTLIAISSQAKGHIEKNTGVSPSHMIPWGVTPDIRDIAKGDEIEEEIDILVVSSMIAVKNYPEILEVISSVQEQFPALKVKVYGEGPLREKIDALIQEMGLGDTIHLMGARPRDEVLSAMQRSKLLLHCSRYEGQGYVFLEALANGLPVVAHDIGFLPRTGSVHICGSTTEMVSAVKMLLTENPEHKPYIPLSMEETVNEYWKIYDQEAKG